MSPVLHKAIKADQIAAFVRSDESNTVFVAVARFPARREFDSSWDTTRIPLPTHCKARIGVSC